MKTLHFPPTKVSHTSKTPHSKSLEPDCLSPLIAITTQSHRGEGKGEGRGFICEKEDFIVSFSVEHEI
jgi:hypothetical protein